MKDKEKNKGIVTALVLVFGSIFVLLFTSLSGFILIQLKQTRQKVAWNQALTIAESGINYYRWHLAHQPEDLQDGEAWCCASPPCSACGPYEHDYSDPEGGVIGNFSLEIQGNQQCGLVSGITIISTGWTNDFPNTKRKVSVKYVNPSVADYAYLLNDNVWAGADREIKGPYHSNGGIRMDGENKSLVASAKETWTCTDSFGCSPSQEMPGVFTTANGNEELFDFPVPPFDFDGITMDLAQIKSLTQGGQGLYFAPSGDQGYHLIFNSDRSVSVYRITQLDSIYAYDSENGWHWEDSVIDDVVFLGDYDIPETCGLIFIEDDLWIEGEIKGKITLVSADLIDPNDETDVWIEGNIEYTTREGPDGLVVVGQHNNLVGLYVPDRTELHGVFIAQSGHFGRNHYDCSWYWPECKRDYLETFGSVVSNGRVGTKWSSGGAWSSGFNQRENIYDPQQSFDPPPFLPKTSEEYDFKEWEEISGE